MNNSHDTRLRRNLIGLTPIGKLPTTPSEVLVVSHDGLEHAVEKQTQAGSPNGIDTWWVETTCGKKLVTTVYATKVDLVSCIDCMTASM